MKRITWIAAATVIAIVAGCGSPREAPARPSSTTPEPHVGTFSEIDVPAGTGAGQPYLAPGSAGEILCSWTEPEGEKFALKMATFARGEWAAPRSIATRDDFFVNWADFPSIASSGDTLYVHWLQRSAPGTYNYDVVVAISRDGGVNWGAPFVVHDDGAMAEHGFASFLPLPDNRAGIAWLDGRAMAGHQEGDGDMAVRYAVISPDGTVSDRSLIDARTCECCTTTVTSTSRGPLVAWRDRSAEEVRDIAIARQLGGTWTAPEVLHEDGWQISGCPVNGPQSDSLGERTVIAWYTAAGGLGEVRIVLSNDGGGSFDPPTTVAAGEGVVGYVDVLFVDEDRALVVWMEDKGDRIDLVEREVSATNGLTDPVVIASTTPGRTGFPRMARSDSEILIAWNEKGETPRIHVARAMISK